MKDVLIGNASRPLNDPLRVPYCDSFLCRLRGLMFRRRIGINEGLLLVQGQASRVNAAIHMLFVFMDLAVFWLDEKGMVVDKRLARSWHPIYLPVHPAAYILELHAARFSDFELGDRLTFEEDREV